MFKRKLLVGFLLISFMFVSLFLTSYAQLKPVTLKIALLYSGTSIDGLAGSHFKELVEKYSEGNIKCDFFPGGQLGTLNAMIEGVQSGTIDIYIESINTWQSYNELLKLHNIPFAFKDKKTFLAHFDSQVFQDYVIKPFLEKNIFFLNEEAGWNWHWGYRVIVCSKHPILTPDDIVGLNFRMPEMKAYVEGWKAIGATPVIIPWNELYLALQMGVVDIATLPITTLYDMKLTEVAKYVTKLEDYYQTMALAMTKSKFDSLPEEYQKILLKACTETGEFYTDLIIASINTIIEKCKEEHGAEFFETDYAPFKEKGEKAIQTLEESGYLVPGLYDLLDD